MPVTTTSRSRADARAVALGALVAALLAASAWVSIPLGTVPVTLQVFVVALAALLLQPMSAFLAITSYLLLGAVGVPVFSGGTGGLGVIVGPTGGYLVGFLIGAWAGAWTRTTIAPGGSARSRVVIADMAAVALCLAAVYALGWLQLAFTTGMGWGAAFAAGVLPFLPVDVVKVLTATAIAAAVRRAI